MEESKESRASKEQCSLSTWPGLSSGGGSAFGEQKVLFLFPFLPLFGALLSA